MSDVADNMASNAPEGSSEIAMMQPRPSRNRLVIALGLLVFIIALAALVWAAAQWRGGLRLSQNADPATVTANGNSMAGSDPMDGMPVAQASTRLPSQVLSADQQETQVAALEQRLTRVAVAAEAASGYASRAEAMMVAFAARRALDAGQPLGYVGGQLRLIFGEAQPKAVATIVNAAEKPVTLSTLRQGLETIGAAVSRGGSNDGWWSSAVRELRGLAVIRHAGTPSPAPNQRLLRARLNVESGQIEAATDEVSALPQRPEITLWLEQARRYNEAHRALDVIEAAAILEPRAVPLVVPVTPPPPAPAAP